MARREPRYLAICFVALAVWLLQPVAEAFCEEPLDDGEAEVEEERPKLETIDSFELMLGYRFITPDKVTAAAAPYERLRSGVTGGFSAASLGTDKLTVDATFLHEDDNHSELFYDHSGYYRLHAENSSFWHNQIAETLPVGTGFATNQSDRGKVYGTRTQITQVENNIKLGNNPFHLKLGYWQLDREGYEQLRFSDYYWSGSVSSTTRRVDNITREGSVGLDGHLKWFDLAYEFRLRDFINKAADPRDLFANTGNGASIAGVQAHDTVPDSRVTSHTIKVYSDLSGGLTGTGAYTLVQRENNNGHGDAIPSARATNNLQQVAGDFTYTPNKQLSFALKYRHQEIEREAPALIYYPFSVAGLLAVRPGIDTQSDTLTFSTIVRPYPRMIYRLEYSAELENRNNVHTQQAAVNELHNDSRQTHTGKISFYWRPSLDLKVNASYSYASCDNPAYADSFSDRHTGKLLLTYTRNGKWGATGSFISIYETANSSASTRVPDADITLNVPETPATFALPRTSRNNSANLSFWFSPIERLTVTTSYSFLQSDTDQTSLLTPFSQTSLVATNYRSTSHVYGLDATYAASEKLDLSLGFQQILSDARYNVPGGASFAATSTFTGQPVSFNSAGITDLTRLDTTETGVSARADWRFNALLGCVLDYTFRKYDSGDPLFDGSVHSTMLSLKARW